MAIYRPSKPRYRIVPVAAIVGLLVGLLAGLVLAGGDPEPVEAVREIRTTLTEASSVLEIVEIEYEEALEDGSGDGNAEYEGARDALERSRSLWAEARPSVDLLAPQEAEEIDSLYEELGDAVADEALPEQVNELIAELSALLDAESD